MPPAGPPIGPPGPAPPGAAVGTGKAPLATGHRICHANVRGAGTRAFPGSHSPGPQTRQSVIVENRQGEAGRFWL